MARVRSPNYPSISLPEAISRVRTIHAEEQHLAAPKEVIAKHLGYGGMNGASIKTISALQKYGLIEEVSGDRVRVSPLAVRILYPQGNEKGEAIREAALKPALFSEIYTEWEGAQPSEQNLRSYLVRRNFSSDALDRVIEAYRETMDLVTQENGGYPANESPNAKRFEGLKQEPSGMQAPAQARPAPSSAVPMSVSFNGDQLHVSAVLVDAEAVEKLIKALNANKTLLPDRSKPSSESTN